MRDETALTTLRWARDPLTCTRRVLVSTHIDSSRRRRWGERAIDERTEGPARPERATDERPAWPAWPAWPAQPVDDPRLIAGDDRDELRRRLGELSPQERTVRSVAGRSPARRRVEVLR
jgi:DNA-directed RNA polymerase specialized sigma24 family protein